MPEPLPRLSVIDGVRRGLASSRANWELVLVQLIQMLVLGVLAGASMVPPLLVVGIEDLEDLTTLPPPEQFEVIASWLQSVWVQLLSMSPPLLLALAATVVIWLIAFLIMCFFSGGTYGILAAGDRQAPAGPPRDWRWFRTFSLRDYLGWGGRLMWRYFWLFNLILLVMTLFSLVLVVLVLAIAWSLGQWGPQAAFGVGCGGSLPVLFGIFLLTMWANLAQADAGQPESRVGLASRRALQALGRRLGGFLGLFVLLFVVSILISLFFAALSMGSGLALGGSPVAGAMVEVLLGLTQWLVTALLTVAMAATVMALIRSENARVEAG